MEMAAGETGSAELRVDFDRRLKLEFYGSRITFGITTQETTKPVRAAFMLRGRLSSRDSAFRLGRNLPTVPSAMGGWGAQMGNVG